MSKLDDKLIDIFKREKWHSNEKDFYSKIYKYLHHNRSGDKDNIINGINNISNESNYSLDNLIIDGEDFKYNIKFDIVLNGEHRAIGSIETRKSYFIHEPEEFFSSIERYDFKTDKMVRIKEYYKSYLLECEKLLVDIFMNCNYCVSYDSQYKTYTLNKQNNNEYNTCINGEFKKYWFGKDSNSLLSYKESYNVLKNMVDIKEWKSLLKYAKENLGYETEQITWKEYKL